jgi:hypothetical protein
MIAINKEEWSKPGVANCLAKTQRGLQAVACMQRHLSETFYEHTSFGTGVFNVRDVIRQIDGMYFAPNMKELDSFDKYPCRFANIGPPFKYVRRLNPRNCRRQKE